MTSSPQGAPDDALGKVMRALSSTPWVRRGLSLLSVALLCGAIGVMGYPLYTNFYATRTQDRLENQFESDEFIQAYSQGNIAEGDSLTRIVIPSLGVDTIVVEGTTASALRAGAGHYPETPLPCAPGNVSIAGHRTTYGKPFHDADRLSEGDEIKLITPIGECTYRVMTDPFIVPPTALEVVGPLVNAEGEPVEGEFLTLTTCHPKNTADERMIIRAVRVRQPEPAAAPAA